MDVSTGSLPRMLAPAPVGHPAGPIPVTEPEHIMGHVIDVGRPLSGDVVDLIIDDHRRMERLLRSLRDTTADRDGLRHAIATVLVAHAEAEESIVYPKLRKRSAITGHDKEHGEEEHAEGHEALLAVLELKGTDTDAFGDAVQELSNAIAHHLAEEEVSILSPAREELGARARRDLGEQWATERNRLIDDGCGTLTNVRRLVARSRREGLLDDDDE